MENRSTERLGFQEEPLNRKEKILCGIGLATAAVLFTTVAAVITNSELVCSDGKEPLSQNNKVASYAAPAQLDLKSKKYHL